MDLLRNDYKHNPFYTRCPASASQEGLATRGVRPPCLTGGAGYTRCPAPCLTGGAGYTRCPAPLPHRRGWLHEVSSPCLTGGAGYTRCPAPLPHRRGWPARLAIEQIQVLCQHILEPHNNGLFPWILSATHTHRGYVQQVTVTPNTANSVLWVHETPPTFSPGEGRAGGLCFFPLACINNGVKDDVIIISPVVHYSTA